MAARKVKTNGQPVKPADIQLQIIRPENYPTIYSNNIQISVSQFDFRLDFGELQGIVPSAPISAASGGAPPPPVQAVVQRVGVTISPKMARTIADILNHLVEEYEKALAKQPAWIPPASQ